jgi:ribonuclease R
MNPNKQTETFVGPISVSSKGVGYFDIPEEGNLPERTLEVQPENLLRAFPGDIVEVQATGQKVRDPKPGHGPGRATRPGEFSRDQGKVVKIVTRHKTQFVGVVRVQDGETFVVPDDKRAYVDIFIGPEDSAKAEPGDKVLVEITDWDAKNLQGAVLKVIGKKGENNAEMESIVLERGFRVEFPPEVEREAAELLRTYKDHFEEDVAARRDMRTSTTMTIDPADAKDFDDAISFSDLGSGMYEIGVHIADVSHFVTPGTALDRESEKRGLSVYLVDRTIPMLPEILSNDLCSLNPHEDKYTFSAVFKMDDQAEIHDVWFGRTVIHSDKRFSYEEAQEVLDNKKDGPYQKELLKLREIARVLEKAKFHNGAINFETEEVKFELDAAGKPIRVYRKQRLDTHKLVEEYMLLANKAVAKYIFQSQKESLTKGKQSVYRIHGVPDKERIQNLAEFIKALGFDLKNKDGAVTSRDIGTMLKEVDGSPQEELIKTATIRSMAKAVYSTKNIGHFGLAFEYYTHFTSPIRRYPDLLVHRFLEREIKGGKIEQNEFEKYERICLASSELEKRAADAERASIKYKQVEYMLERVGQTFDGTISGVTEWGIYIEDKETKCEGMVKIRDLGDDYFSFDEKHYRIKGDKTGKTYTLGDSVRFKVISADMEKRILDYALV